jgi:carbon-monoxide dehydrogenase large subunit
VSVGAAVRRFEDPPLLQGRGRYVADLIPPGALHAAILRSPYAHAELGPIGTDAACALAGVVDVVTAADLPTAAPMQLAFGLDDPEIEARCLANPLARERVRYVGEPVAVVLADSRYVAEDALALIEAEYEPLPAVVDLDNAVADDAPLLVPELGTNVVMRLAQSRPVPAEAFQAAEVVVEATLDVSRHFAVPMEGRGLVAEHDPRRGLTVWGPTKRPHLTRASIARFTGLPEHDVHVIEPDVGGGFGARGEVYPEDLLVPWLAMRTGRPVAWIEDRREHLTTTNQSREQRHRARFAVSSDGRIQAFEDRFLNNQGAYVRGNGVAVSDLTLGLLPGPYKIPHFDAEVGCVISNTTPTDVYRAPGRYEGTFVRERLVDMAARRLGMDPIELRRRNMIQRSEYPYAVGTRALGSDTVYDKSDPLSLLEQAAEAIDAEGFRSRQAAARADGGPLLGLGVGMFVEKSGYGPWEYGRIEVSPAGEVVLYTGIAALGQGLATTLAQVVADELGAAPADVRVVHGETDRVPFGIGAFASRGAVVGGTAALVTAQRLRAKMLRLASHELEVSESDLELADNGVQVRGAPFRRRTFAELARAALPGEPLPEGMEPGLTESAVWSVDHMTYPSGACLCTVEVDPGSGGVSVLDVVVAYDIGRALNPTIVEGQIHGGVVQGIGGALLEEVRYDADGQPLCTTFMDYLLPGATEAPRSLRVILDETTPSELNPLGAKGAGEAGITGMGAAVANAVSDALAPAGGEITKLPITPADVRRAAGTLS